MKRRLTKLVVFLVLGVVVNVAVAWGIAARLGQYDVDVALKGMVDLEDARSFDWWAQNAPDRFDREPSTVASGSLLGASWVMACVWPGDHGSPPLQVLIRLRTGWPGRSMDGACWGDPEDDCIYDGAIEVGHDTSANVGLLPVRPIWPGFAINTIVFALVLWLLTLGPFAARRVVRRKRGHCIKCGYDLRGATHDRCPECGGPT